MLENWETSMLIVFGVLIIVLPILSHLIKKRFVQPDNNKCVKIPKKDPNLISLTECSFESEEYSYHVSIATIRHNGHFYDFSLDEGTVSTPIHSPNCPCK